MPIVAAARLPLANTGLVISRFGMGSGPIGGLNAPVADADATATVDAAFAAGIRHFDTAPQYGTGLSELRLGRALQGKPRDSYVLSSKVGKIVVPKGSGGIAQTIFTGGTGDEIVFDYSYDGAMRSLEMSLGRLGLDRIDVLLIHDVTRRFHGDAVEARYRQCMDGAYKALLKLRGEGVVKAIGTGLSEIDWATRFMSEGDFDVMLLPGRYTLLEQTAADGLLDLAHRRGVAVLLAAAFESGILATGAVPGATFLYQPAAPEIMARVRRIEAICRDFAVPLAAAALQFPLTHPAIASVVAGMRSPAEVAQNLAWLAHDIPADLWRALARDGILRPDLPGLA